MTIQKAIKEIILQKGEQIFANSKELFNLLVNLAPEYQKDIKIMKNIIDDDILKIFIDDTKEIDYKIKILQGIFQREFMKVLPLLPNDPRNYIEWTNYIIESFGIPLGWGDSIKLDYDIRPIQTNLSKKQSRINQIIKENAKDVALDENVLQQLGYEIVFENKGECSQITYLKKDGKYTISLDIPPFYEYNGQNYKITKIASKSFYNFNTLDNIIIPETVTEIGEEAFCYCDHIKKIVMSENITKIGKKAFAYCKYLKAIIIPDHVTKIEKETFFQCNSLERVIMPINSVKIEENAFYACKKLKSKIEYIFEK